MNSTDVAWTRDQHGKPVLELKPDGHPACVRSSQRTDLTDRGIVEGIVFLNSERRSQLPNAYISGNYAPTYQGLDLVGRTDDPEVFALYREMCAAIRADTWHEGARPGIACSESRRQAKTGRRSHHAERPHLYQGRRRHRRGDVLRLRVLPDRARERVQRRAQTRAGSRRGEFRRRLGVC